MTSHTPTLFSFFKRKHKPDDDSKSESIASSSKSRTVNDEAADNTSSVSPPVKKLKSDDNIDPTFVCGDLVWAKIYSYPYWPALVYNHPTKSIYTKGTGQQKEVNVQFFQVDGPTRGWVKIDSIDYFDGKDDEAIKTGSKYYSTMKGWKEAVDIAQLCFKLNKTKRLVKYIVCNAVSSEEDEPVVKVSTNSKRNGRKRRIKVDSSDDENDKSYHSIEITSTSDIASESDDVSDDDSGDRKIVCKTPVSRKKKSTVATPSTKFKSFELSEPAITKSTPSNLSTTPVSRSKPATGERTKSFLSSFVAFDEVSTVDNSSDTAEIKFKHLSFPFLLPSKIRDIDCRKPDDPEYDNTTLHIPESFMKNETPGHKQWWSVKERCFDCILLFKVGKFYELYHMDAVTAVNELNLTYMRGEYAHCGFPEVAYGRFTDQLVERGYKVVRVEQTETPQMLEERAKNVKGVNKPKVVRREVCRITTAGTKTYSFLDGQCNKAQARFLIAFCEQKSDNSSVTQIGICAVDTTIGRFILSQFEDDSQRSRLRTFLAQFPPAEILTEKGFISDETHSVVKVFGTIVVEGLARGSQFLSSIKTLARIAQSSYFTAGKEEGNATGWPSVLSEMLTDTDTLGLTAKETSQLAVRSLGACIWYLSRCLIDHDMMSMRNFEYYYPLDLDESVLTKDQSANVKQLVSKKMILDSVSLQNLDITCSSADIASIDGTLLQSLNNCSTPFGERLLHHWLCMPLCDPVAINDRLDAIEDLMQINDFANVAIKTLRNLPDLERLLQKIHTLGSKDRSLNHPDSRAVMFEQGTYSKRKINDFVAVLEAFCSISTLIDAFTGVRNDVKSSLLFRLLCITDDDQNIQGCFPSIFNMINQFKNSFDPDQAKKDGFIVPLPGTDSKYDDCCDRVSQSKTKLDEYLIDLRRKLNSSKITYLAPNGRNPYHIEIPDSVTSGVGSQFDFKSSRKGFKRYTTEKSEALAQVLTEAEEFRDQTLRDNMRHVFALFDASYETWKTAVSCIAQLDVLLSFVQYSKSLSCNSCRPDIVLPDDCTKPFIEIHNGYHPCIGKIFTSGDYIPNDCFIGTKSVDFTKSEGSTVLITGPNMGGKSTLMRQISLIVVLAQLGCHVPAKYCKLTPVDRLFTRIGANDRLLAGQSTFFVELNECSSILRHATRHSLVILDELGRGTATHDGTAIAYASMKDLSTRVECRTLFATHYHSLIEDFIDHPNVAFGHMACMTEKDDIDNPNEESVTFLYRFVSGSCPKSFGFYAAKLADIPLKVVKKARDKSNNFELPFFCANVLKFCNTEGDSPSDQKIKELYERIKNIFV